MSNSLPRNTDLQGAVNMTDEISAANPAAIRIEEFDYPLPDGRIASHPLEQRDQCLLLVRRPDGAISDHIFAELPQLLPEDSMLVYNNTKVINARLRFRKSTPGAQQAGALIEIFCLEPHAPADYAESFAQEHACSWTCFVGNSKRWKSGVLEMTLTVENQEIILRAERESREGNTSVVRFSWDGEGVTFSRIISAVGEIPIPPYLNRQTEDSDNRDYQTVYSRIEGSVAAPTAGLHFTDRVLADIDRRGIPRRELTLHVGAGTFQPVKTDTIGEHPMHAEFIAVPMDLLRDMAEALDGTHPRRIIAVGTTSVRTLESLYHAGRLMMAGVWDGEVPQWSPYTPLPAVSEKTSQCDAAGVPADVDPTPAEALRTIIRHLEATDSKTFIASTRIIIAPGYRYRIVSGMVTNFHQPKSTLLLLVSAFTGGDWRRIYDHALAGAYRFLSYGDACLLLK